MFQLIYKHELFQSGNELQQIERHLGIKCRNGEQWCRREYKSTINIHKVFTGISLLTHKE